MTDRVKGFTVILEKPIREDNIRPIMDAIQQIRGVLAVTQIQESVDDLIVERRVRHDLTNKLFELLKEPK